MPRPSTLTLAKPGVLDVQGMQGPPPWGSFLASLQASHTQQKPSNKDVVKNWGGTVFWNGIWEQSIISEAEEAKKEQQAAVEAGQASNSDGPEATAASATGCTCTSTYMSTPANIARSTLLFQSAPVRSSSCCLQATLMLYAYAA